MPTLQIVDNSSAYRMAEGVPLVIPEINPEAADSVQIGKVCSGSLLSYAPAFRYVWNNAQPELAATHRRIGVHVSARISQGGIVANPNCSTIIALMAVAPLHREAAVRRMVVSTYQACPCPPPPPRPPSQHHLLPFSGTTRHWHLLQARTCTHRPMQQSTVACCDQAVCIPAGSQRRRAGGDGRAGAADPGGAGGGGCDTGHLSLPGAAPPSPPPLSLVHPPPANVASVCFPSPVLPSTQQVNSKSLDECLLFCTGLCVSRCLDASDDLMELMGAGMQYAFNLFSHNAPMTDSGYNEEEMKMVKETRKILSALDMKITATCIRVRHDSATAAAACCA